MLLAKKSWTAGKENPKEYGDYYWRSGTISFSIEDFYPSRKGKLHIEFQPQFLLSPHSIDSDNKIFYSERKGSVSIKWSR